MNKATNDILKLIVLVFVVPVVIISFVMELPSGSSAQAPAPETTQSIRETLPPQTSQPATVPPVTEPSIPETEATQMPTQPPEAVIMVNISGNIQQMPLEDYVLGVVLAEMPASFHMEALKAQAVACRSYAMVGARGRGNHKEGYVCTSSACCQAYTAPEEYIQKGGKWEHVQKVADAVEQTRGEVLTYQGELVLATYFSCSGGSTEAAVTVFGVSYPYLQSVSSPGEEFAEVFYDTVLYMPEEFAAALRADLTGAPETWIGEMTYTQGGGVHSVVIGNATYDGLTIKALLGLRSTVFTMKVTDAGIQVETKGFGHRVGMSQYGAQAMAEAGSSYHDILLHYYVGTTLKQSAVIF